MAWHYEQEGDPQGPVSVDELRQAIAAGTVDRQTLVWRQGLSGWQALEEVAELSGLLGDALPPVPVPPPLPVSPPPPPALPRGSSPEPVNRELETGPKPSDEREQECVYPNGGTFRSPDLSTWGAGDEVSYSHCLALLARINGVMTSTAFSCVFGSSGEGAVTEILDGFIASERRLLRVCLSGIPFELKAREIISNTIARHLLTIAREGSVQNQPTIVVLDEAHKFVGRRIGSEDHATRLDAFELIAKEGRKYGLNICLVNQRPRDLTEGVLSQIGTLVVHRLTNDRDREVVERACGEIDRAAAAFLPNLRPGEAAVIGTDFPIPLTIRVREPTTKPKSDGPNYQQHWANHTEASGSSGTPT